MLSVLYATVGSASLMGRSTSHHGRKYELGRCTALAMQMEIDNGAPCRLPVDETPGYDRRRRSYEIQPGIFEVLTSEL